MVVCYVCGVDSAFVEKISVSYKGSLNVKKHKLCMGCYGICRGAFTFMGAEWDFGVYRHNLSKRWIDEYLEDRDYEDFQRPSDDTHFVPFKEQKMYMDLITLKRLIPD